MPPSLTAVQVNRAAFASLLGEVVSHPRRRPIGADAGPEVWVEDLHALFDGADYLLFATLKRFVEGFGPFQP